MYGTQAITQDPWTLRVFENDVKMYGTQALLQQVQLLHLFENDVKMYGTQAGVESGGQVYGLRMM